MFETVQADERRSRFPPDARPADRLPRPLLRRRRLRGDLPALLPRQAEAGVDRRRLARARAPGRPPFRRGRLLRRGERGGGLPLLPRHHELVSVWTARMRLDRGVATYDLGDMDVDNVNKFIAYAADASTLYTVSVSRGPNRSKISLGSKPWKQQLRRHNLARIAERYGGGGHPAVAAISLPPDRLQEARAAAATIADELRQPTSSS